MLKGKKKGAASYAVLAIILAIVLIFTILALLPKPQNRKGENPLLKKGDMPILVAHRGGDGEFPGNTLEAFYNAYSVDERVIMETDANITKDGVLILCHETYLDKRTDASGEIIDWNYSDMMEQKVNFGYHNDVDSGKLTIFTDENGNEIKPTDLENYPEGLKGRDKDVYLATTFEELLLAFPNNIISIEIKQGGDIGLAAMREAIRIVEKHNAFDRVIFASFKTEIGKEFKDLYKSGELPENFMYSPSLIVAIKYVALYYTGLDVFFREGITVLQIPMEEYGFNLSSKRFIEFAHKHNIAVHYWTINNKDDMRTLIENGADAIMTDYPHKLKEVIDSYSE
jgi:glycerophosphoryl diester phosphodiesterase